MSPAQWRLLCKVLWCLLHKAQALSFAAAEETQYVLTELKKEWTNVS